MWIFQNAPRTWVRCARCVYWSTVDYLVMLLMTMWIITITIITVIFLCNDVGLTFSLCGGKTPIFLSFVFIKLYSIYECVCVYAQYYLIVRLLVNCVLAYWMSISVCFSHRIRWPYRYTLHTLYGFLWMMRIMRKRGSVRLWFYEVEMKTKSKVINHRRCLCVFERFCWRKHDIDGKPAVTFLLVFFPVFGAEIYK